MSETLRCSLKPAPRASATPNYSVSEIGYSENFETSPASVSDSEHGILPPAPITRSLKPAPRASAIPKSGGIL